MKPERYPINEDKQSLQPDDDSLYDIKSMASANDCTGLIPSAPASEEEADSYTDMYPIPRPAEESPEKIERRADPAKESPRRS